MDAIYEKYGVTNSQMLEDALNALCDYVDAAGKYDRRMVMVAAEEAQAAEGAGAYGKTALVGHVQTDKDRKVTSVDAGFSAICGHPLNEIIGRSLGAVLQGPETEPGAVAKLRAALDKRKPVRVQITNHHKDGRNYTVDLSITPTDTGFSGEARLIS